MFWKFHLVSSGLDTLLSKEDVTLKEVLDEEDILQECKTQNAKLVEFLSKDEILPELLDLAIKLPPEDGDEKTQFKYSNIACEVISSDIDVLIDKIATEKVLLDKVWGFLDNPPPLNPLMSSFFAKIVATVLGKKGLEVFEYIRENDCVNKLMNHLEISAIMEVFIKLMSVMDSHEVKMKMEKWLEEQELVQKLVKSLHPENLREKHCNASNLLSELVRMGRESPVCFGGESEDSSRLFLTIEKEEVLLELLDIILSDGSDTNAESSLVNGMNVLLSLIEFKRPNPEGLEEFFTPMNAERIAQGVQSALKVITPRLKDFHKVLIDPPTQSPMLTTVGTLDPPLGRVRLHVAWLISAVIVTNTPYVNRELTELGTVNVLLDLFFKYQWNNFLHAYVEHSITSILSSEVQDDDDQTKHSLLMHLMCDCCLVTRILDAWQDNDSQQSKKGGKRKGYMGHLARIANSLANNVEKGPNSEMLLSLLSDLPEDIQSDWKELVEGSLSDLNKKNTMQMQLSSHMLHSSSEDEDDGMFKSVSILQYESSLQQVQQLSNEFIESFGHNEEDLNDMSKARNPFDEIGNVDFTINANEETPDAQLFEAVCNEKIHQFDDSGSDEEDIWEERELKYSPKTTSKRRAAESNSDESLSSSEESSGSSDEEAVFSDDDKQNKSLTPKQNEVIGLKETEVKMEVDMTDADWSANFDSDGVAMDTLDAASVGWVDPSATSVVDVKDEAGFADFTDISKISFESNPFDEPKNPEPPVAMDEDSNDAFKMDSSTKSADETVESKDVLVEDVKMEDVTPNAKEDSAEKKETETRRNENEEKRTEPVDEKSLELSIEADKTTEGTEKKTDTEPVDKANNPGDVKADTAEAESDPLVVTSKDFAGFVVIESSQSPTKKEEVEPNKEKNVEKESSPDSSKKDALSPSNSGVSVVTVSSRKVININSEGKVESKTPPRSPKISRSKSPKSPEAKNSPTITKLSASPPSPNKSPPSPKKSPKSPKKSLQSPSKSPPSPNKSPPSPKKSLESPSKSPTQQRTELIVERPQVNGPVKSSLAELEPNQVESNEIETSQIESNQDENKDSTNSAMNEQS